MESEFDASEADVERKIEGEFMTTLQNSEVPFEITEVMEDLIEEPDLGGDEEIIDQIETEMLDNGD